MQENKKQIPSQSMSPEEYISYLHKLGTIESLSNYKPKVFIVIDVSMSYPVYVFDSEDKAKKWIEENKKVCDKNYEYFEREVK